MTQCMTSTTVFWGVLGGGFWWCFSRFLSLRSRPSTLAPFSPHACDVIYIAQSYCSTVAVLLQYYCAAALRVGVDRHILARCDCAVTVL